MTDQFILSQMQAQLDALTRTVKRHQSQIDELTIINRDKTDRLTLAKNFALHAQRVASIIEDLAGGYDIDIIASRAKDVMDGARFCFDQVQSRVDAAARALVGALDISDE